MLNKGLKAQLPRTDEGGRPVSLHRQRLNSFKEAILFGAPEPCDSAGVPGQRPTSTRGSPRPTYAPTAAEARAKIVYEAD
jgi:hypothetical protein